MGTRNWSTDVSSKRHEESRLDTMKFQLRNDMCVIWTEGQLPERDRRLEAEAQLISAYSLLTEAQAEINGEEFAGQPSAWAFEDMEELKNKLWEAFEGARKNEEPALESAASLSAAAAAFVNATQAYERLDNRDTQIKAFHLNLRHDDLSRPRYGHGIKTI